MLGRTMIFSMLTTSSQETSSCTQSHPSFSNIKMFLGNCDNQEAKAVVWWSVIFFQVLYSITDRDGVWVIGFKCVINIFSHTSPVWPNPQRSLHFISIFLLSYQTLITVVHITYMYCHLSHVWNFVTLDECVERRGISVYTCMYTSKRCSQSHCM